MAGSGRAAGTRTQCKSADTYSISVGREIAVNNSPNGVTVKSH